MYTNKELYERILADVMMHPYFAEFKYRKWDKTLYKQANGIKHFVQFQYWTSRDSTDQLVIFPQYMVRFDVIMKWFERFSVRPIKTQRNDWHEGFSGKKVSRQRYFIFDKDEKNYDSELNNLIETMIFCCNKIMHDYATLQDYYEMNVVPLLNRSVEIPGTGAEWTFQYLTLCKLVAPEKYDELKSIIIPQFKKLYERREPNVMFYYPRLNEILDYLENNDITKG